MGMIFARLLPFLITGLVAASVAFFVGRTHGVAQSHKLGVNFVRAYFFDAQECRIDKAALISQVGQERQRGREIIERFQSIEKLSGKAKARLMADLDATRKKLADEERESSEALQRLQEEISEDAENWKQGVIPPDITCGVFRGSGCADRQPAARPDDRDGNLAILDEPADAGS